MFIRGRPVQLFVPEAMTGTYALSKVSPAPSVRPKLEWVYGYRGRDARSNLYLLPTGKILEEIRFLCTLLCGIIVEPK